MKEKELTCTAILVQRPKKLDGPNWAETAYHWAVVLTITEETRQQSLQINYKTGNGCIDKPKKSYMGYTESMQRAFAAGIKEEPNGSATGRYKPTVPTLTDICYALRSDYEFGGYTFREFVSEIGGENAADDHDVWEACKRQREDLDRAGITPELLDKYIPEDY